MPLDILFLGGLFPKETEKDILSKSIGSVQQAANNLQWELVIGLGKNNKKPIKIVNSLHIGSFPKKYKELMIKTYSFSHIAESRSDINVGFINLPVVKSLSRINTLKKEISKWISDGGCTEKKVIIAYAMIPVFTQILEYVKKKNIKIVTCLIVPDLPQFMNFTYSRNFVFYKIFKVIQFWIIRKNMRCIDSYVLLTDAMRFPLKLNSPYVVVEGIAPFIPNKHSIPNDRADKKYIEIMYSGGLVEEYGVLDLVEAFKSITRSDLRLIICGSGPCLTKIVSDSQSDTRIVVKGQLSRDKVIELQSSVTLLVNPRRNDFEYTKYSFPSKILEYFASGTPVLAYMLDGMPEEYRSFFFQIQNNGDSIDSLKISLESILNKPKCELEKMGNMARHFVRTEKNGVKQCEKIYKMLYEM